MQQQAILGRSVSTKQFFEEYWRKKPRVFKKLVHPSFLRSVDKTSFISWCRPPAVARIYIRMDTISPGRAKAVFLESAKHAADVIRTYRESDKFTVLLNNVEKVSSKMRALREAFGIGRSWRYDDIVVTYSVEGSGVGFHAGHEDGFIVQLAGRRTWSLWNPSILPKWYTRALLGDTPPQKMVAPPPRPKTAPAYQVDLDTGDVLYIPPLMAHEGVTTKNSISASIAWVGVSPIRILSRMHNVPKLLGSLPELPDGFFDLLPDCRTLEDELTSSETNIARLVTALARRRRQNGIV